MTHPIIGILLILFVLYHLSDVLYYYFEMRKYEKLSDKLRKEIEEGKYQ
jgi:hypothetical protein